jgi:hypothetical protein
MINWERNNSCPIKSVKSDVTPKKDAVMGKDPMRQQLQKEETVSEKKMDNGFTMPNDFTLFSSKPTYYKSSIKNRDHYDR